MFVSAIGNIKLVYGNRNANRLADPTIRKAYQYNTQTVS